jgi:3-deoxy-manno-octulosonate cytidylyltransferase (CMP-KDO synthetase)
LSIVILIPARLASTRLPNKPLADIAGAPMVVRVAQRVQGLSTQGDVIRVVVAGDSPDIIQACGDHGVTAVLTRSDHPSGSDRLAEACQLLGLDDDDIVVNVQGDEPLIDPDLVLAVAELLAKTPGASMSTAAHAIDNFADYANPNAVKVVLDAQGIALYFSRAMIPFERDRPYTLPIPPPLRHIGIYGYRVGFLRQFPNLPQAPMEVSESLEQLRVLWHGHRIVVHIARQAPGPGVDTPEDLDRVRGIFLP